MNEFLLEICERKQYVKTMKLLKRQMKTSASLQRLDNFIFFKTKMVKTKSMKPTNKLSFEINMVEKNTKFCLERVDKYMKEWV